MARAFAFWSIAFIALAFAQSAGQIVDLGPIQANIAAMQSTLATLSSKVPNASIASTMYASTCNVTVNTTTAVSTFCPVGTDTTSVSKRTLAAGAASVGKAYKLDGGGSYSVPTGNLNTADIKVLFGSSVMINLTTPAAPVGTNQGVDFHAICTVRAVSGTSATMNCTGVFAFVVAGAASVLAPFNQTATFDPTIANLIDVTGDWNNSAGALTTQTTTVTQAVLTALN